MKGKFDEAIELCKQSLAIQKKIKGNTHPDVGMGLANLSVALWKQGDFDGALPLLEEASEIFGGHPAMLKDIEVLKRHGPCPH